MSAQNGGRGEPPVPPEGHGPPPQQEIPISKEIVQAPEVTTCERTEEGIRLGFVVIEGMQAVRYVWEVGEKGKQLILEEATGGIELARPGDLPPTGREATG